jgi:protein-disulfide isomerase
LALEHKDDVKYVWRDFPLEDIHPTAKAAAVAASCAGRSGRYWQMQDKLFANQGSFERDDLAGYAEQIGMDRDAFLKCLDAGGDKERIAADIAAGTKAVIRGTPTLFVNGARIEGAVPYEILKQIVDRLVK